MKRFFLGVLMVCLAAAPAAAGLLTAQLEMAEGSNWVAANEAALVRFTLHNDSTVPVQVLRWQTPLAGIEHDIFVVERDGRPVPYIGMLAKRPAPSAEDFVTIAPGATLEAEFDPTAAYEMLGTGEYSIRYRGVRVQAADRSAAKRRLAISDLEPLESNQLVFFLEGLPAEFSGSAESHAKGVDCTKKPDHPQCGGGGGEEPPPSGGGSVSFVGCTSQQANKALGAVEDAGIISRAAANDLNSGISPLYERWFGTYTSSRYGTVSGNFDAIAAAFEQEEVTINCTDARQPYYAYVYPNDPYVIYVCKYFFRAPSLGRDSKAGTLVHEMSHFRVVAGTDDVVYGESNALWLAQNNPNDAIKNADNHEYFAEDQ